MESVSPSLKRSTLLAAVCAYLVSLPYQVMLQAEGAAPGMLGRALDNPSVIFHWLLGAFVFTFLLAGIHIGIASLFKSQRNKTSRMKILRGWSIVMILIVGLNLLLTFLQT